MARVWELTEQSGARLSVLLALADLSDDDGRALVGVATLATKTRMERRLVHRVLDDLQASGEVVIEGAERPGGRKHVRIHLGGN